MKKNSHCRGFILLEVLIGVMIFSVGVLALGKCVNNCLAAQIVTAEDQRARLALENRMAQIEGGEVKVDTIEKKEKLKGMFNGMEISQKRTPLKLKNEKDKRLDNLFVIDLEVSWKSGTEPQSKSLSFYALQTK
ncbi:MAG: prepilin-type N-terminal cleavage/methylation domain-containing protein [Verrucomicrobiota bacterium]